ncbi:hypothetical protein SAM23877_3252 [Streptomyces ambofaciens ATCC 23877]|uniref:Uncharacterized protein n=1 Tax=Streptomyces ambofaciens (strain ATCC 23877 / 3486 / DSM 40053 / JCM 4204 / NBRC 12836 / NRRL B-2516) TaxID=278992 RepID=A0A0K2ATH0_STRA7|nr:hypothetical protein SAM23877_3252 [Streptomyces ambofaciens ATCC 23877]
MADGGWWVRVRGNPRAVRAVYRGERGGAERDGRLACAVVAEVAEGFEGSRAPALTWTCARSVGIASPRVAQQGTA